MGGLAVTLLAITFISVLIFPPVAVVVVPACSLVWIIAYIRRNT